MHIDYVGVFFFQSQDEKLIGHIKPTWNPYIEK